LQPRHDQHIGRAGQAAERVEFHHPGVKRGIGCHFAFIFKAWLLSIKDRHRFTNITQPLARRVAEGRIAEERNARFMPHAPRNRCGFAGDMGKFGCVGAFVDSGIGEEGGVVLADHHVDAERQRAILVIEHQVHLAHGLRKGAGHAGDHPVAMAQRHQQRGKHVAFLIHHPAHVTFGKAAPLQPLVEVIDHRGHVFAIGRVLDFKTAGIGHRKLMQLVEHCLGATHEDRRAIAEIAELDRGAQHHFFFRLGKHHAFGVGLGDFVNPAQHRGGGVEARTQLDAIGVEIVNPRAGHARIHRCLGHSGRHDFDQARVKRGRDDVIGAEFLVLAIGRRDLFGHAATGKFGNRLGCGNFHLFVDGGRLHIQRAAKDEREAQHIIDLIGKIAAPGGDDRIGAHSLGSVRHDFGNRVGHRKDDRPVCHLAHPFRLQRARR